jgi:hypothetical protein
MQSLGEIEGGFLHGGKAVEEGDMREYARESGRILVPACRNRREERRLGSIGFLSGLLTFFLLPFLFSLLYSCFFYGVIVETAAADGVIRPWPNAMDNNLWKQTSKGQRRYATKGAKEEEKERKKKAREDPAHFWKRNQATRSTSNAINLGPNRGRVSTGGRVP